MEGVLFEILSAPQSWPREKTDSWAAKIAGIMRECGISCLNLPEVVSESRQGERVVNLLPKMDHLQFGQMIKSHLPGAELIPNKISVRLAKDDFKDWTESAYGQGIRQLVLVGGESHQVTYPGFSVTEAAQFIKGRFRDMELGGITIFTRKNEAERILAKMKSGIGFFISQIVFEDANLKQVLTTLKRLTDAQGLKFPKVYISLAPASRIKDIEFMKWLGVEFPSAIHSYLVEREEGLAVRTFEVAERVMEEIFDFIERSGLDLGFNVEHITFNNLVLTERLLKGIRERSS